MVCSALLKATAVPALPRPAPPKAKKPTAAAVAPLSSFFARKPPPPPPPIAPALPPLPTDAGSRDEVPAEPVNQPVVPDQPAALPAVAAGPKAGLAEGAEAAAEEEEEDGLAEGAEVGAGLSEYEQQRLANIARNTAMLASLGLDTRPVLDAPAREAAENAKKRRAARAPVREYLSSIFTAFPCVLTAIQCLKRCAVLNSGRPP